MEVDLKALLSRIELLEKKVTALNLVVFQQSPIGEDMGIKKQTEQIKTAVDKLTLESIKQEEK